MKLPLPFHELESNRMARFDSHFDPSGRFSLAHGIPISSCARAEPVLDEPRWLLALAVSPLVLLAAPPKALESLALGVFGTWRLPTLFAPLPLFALALLAPVLGADRARGPGTSAAIHCAGLLPATLLVLALPRIRLPRGRRIPASRTAVLICGRLV
jgi:hypothetical protein